MEFGDSCSLLCEETMDSILGCVDKEGGVPDHGKNLDFSEFVGLQLESDKFIESLMKREKEQLIGTTTGHYLESLNNGGLVLSWRMDAIDWICKVRAHYNFGPLCFYLAVNYLDRFLSSKQLSNDTPWAQQLLAVACVSLAAKMEEVDVPRSVDLQQVCDAKYVFEAKSVERMEILLLIALQWRTHSVTPFSYIDYFLNMFNEGKQLTHYLVSRCTDLILGTLKAINFLKFRPSEIAVAVALSVATEAKVTDFNSALVASTIPVDKENVRRCHEAMQEMALLNMNTHSGTSPSSVLDAASCFIFDSGDNRTPGP